MEDITGMMKSSQQYSKLSAKEKGVDVDEADDDHHQRPRPNLPGWRRLLTGFVIALPWCLTTILALQVWKDHSWGSNRFEQTKLLPSQQTYSPAQDEIKYVVRTFEQNLKDAPIEFLDPETVDDAWMDLYNFGLNAISREEASRLPNRTSNIIKGHPDQYLIELDVFHQLHCLDKLRMAVEPFYGLKANAKDALQQARKEGRPIPTLASKFPKRSADEHPGIGHEDLNAEHLNHCINSLRQSIMCHGDISPVVWHWNDKLKDGREPFNRGFLSVTHTCRDFEKLRQWGRKRTIDSVLIRDQRSAGEIENVPIWP
ncbi:hypothetical protein PRZ48_014734 [Zasmidium cellare]|uniref:Tat pathway signal sequence n=1 Tax=Zasmidium cellare TaxID=395010 RepID=A0ABR0DZK9_ZASCE|nr:hypothetical protein PRZ48_014734 [Zasmidium cellare]